MVSYFASYAFLNSGAYEVPASCVAGTPHHTVHQLGAAQYLLNVVHLGLIHHHQRARKTKVPRLLYHQCRGGSRSANQDEIRIGSENRAKLAREISVGVVIGRLIRRNLTAHTFPFFLESFPPLGAVTTHSHQHSAFTPTVIPGDFLSLIHIDQERRRNSYRQVILHLNNCWGTAVSHHQELVTLLRVDLHQRGNCGKYRVENGRYVELIPQSPSIGDSLCGVCLIVHCFQPEGIPLSIDGDT